MESAFEVFDSEDITYAYDTVYIIQKNDPDVDLEPLRKYLNSIGDSLVIGEDDEAFKVHVHTNIPAFGRQLKYGTVSDYGAHKDACQDLLLFYSNKQGKLISLK